MRHFLPILLIISLLMGVSCKRAKWTKMEDIDTSIIVKVKGALEAPTISWQGGPVNTVMVSKTEQLREGIWMRKETMWLIIGDTIKSPITYGNVPQGAMQLGEIKPLKKGVDYCFMVARGDTIGIGRWKYK